MTPAEAARRQHPYVVEIRRALHRIPETRYETQETRRRILAELAALPAAPRGVTVGLPRELPGGILLDVEVDGARDRVLLRADFDALPVAEATGLPFASEHEGRSHACGHDVHTAALLGFLRGVAQGDVAPRHRLRLAFQDAEENPGAPPDPVSGGEKLVASGALDGVDGAYALHVWAGDGPAPGTFASRAGALLGNSGRVRLDVSTRGGHVASPAPGANALRVAHAIAARLDGFAERHLPPGAPAVVEPVVCRAGTASNVLPAAAELWYGFRTLLPRDQHAAATERLVAEARAEAERVGARLEAAAILGHPALLNDPAAFRRVRERLERCGEPVAEARPMLGGEDFAHYLYRVPGALFLLGVGGRGCGPQHAPTFQPDEQVLWKAVLFWNVVAAG